MFEISELDKKELLKYLAQRPYIEVAALVNIIASLKPIKKENGKDKVTKQYCNLEILKMQ